MSLLKKIFGTLTEKPWEQDQAVIDSTHSGKTFEISNQMSAVIIIFGVSTTLFSLIFTGYLYSLPPEQDTNFILKTNLLWIKTLVLILVTIFFNRISKDLKNEITNTIKRNLIYVGSLSYIFFISSVSFMVPTYEKWKFCFNQYIFFILLFLYCITWYSSIRRSLFLGQSKFKNF